MITMGCARPAHVAIGAQAHCLRPWITMKRSPLAAATLLSVRSTEPRSIGREIVSCFSPPPISSRASTLLRASTTC